MVKHSTASADHARPSPTKPDQARPSLKLAVTEMWKPPNALAIPGLQLHRCLPMARRLALQPMVPAWPLHGPCMAPALRRKKPNSHGTAPRILKQFNEIQPQGCSEKQKATGFARDMALAVQMESWNSCPFAALPHVLAPNSTLHPNEVLFCFDLFALTVAILQPSRWSCREATLPGIQHLHRWLEAWPSFHLVSRATHATFSPGEGHLQLTTPASADGKDWHGLSLPVGSPHLAKCHGDAVRALLLEQVASNHGDADPMQRIS